MSSSYRDQSDTGYRMMGICESFKDLAIDEKTGGTVVSKYFKFIVATVQFYPLTPEDTAKSWSL